MKLTIKDITLIAILSVILFVQEEALNFLPNISLTVFLIVLYSKKLGFFKTSIIVFIYCLLDNLVMGGFNIMYTPFMLIGWLLIPLLLNTVFKRVDKPLSLALLGILFSLLYSWIFIIPNIMILHVDLFAYLISDIPFEILLSTSSFLSLYLLYKPCSSLFYSQFLQ